MEAGEGGEEGTASGVPLRLRDTVRVTGPNSRNVEVVGHYHLGNELGRGFYGVVRKALNIETGDFVAVKTMSLAGFDELVLENIEREITTLRGLDHRHIVRYLKFIKQGSNLHVVLEYVENGSLRDILKRFGPLPESVVQLYARQLLEGLQYLHGMGIVHRDIKASNVLITKEGHCKLADFGACFITTEEQSSPGLVSALGAPYWLAPEVAMGGPIEQPSSIDIWSFGCTLYELVTGSPPWGDLQPLQALFKLHSEPFPELPPDVECGDDLRDLIKTCCQRRPNARPSARVLLNHPFLTNPVQTPKMERMKTAKDLRALLEEAHAIDQKRKAEGLLAAPQHRGTLFVDYRNSVSVKRGMPKWRPAIIDTDEPLADGSLAKDVQRLLNKVLVQEKDLMMAIDSGEPLGEEEKSPAIMVDTTASSQLGTDAVNAGATVCEAPDIELEKGEDAVGDHCSEPNDLAPLVDEAPSTADEDRADDIHEAEVPDSAPAKDVPIDVDACSHEEELMRLRADASRLQAELMQSRQAHLETVASAKETLALVDSLQQARKASFIVAEEYKNIAEEAVMDRKMVLMKLQKVEDQWSPSESFNQLHLKMKAQQHELSSYRALEEKLSDEQLAMLVFGSLAVEHLLGLQPELAGWVQKRSIKGDANESRKSGWKLRLFILKANFLFYFKGDKDLQPVGIIQLDKFSICKGAVAGMQDRGVLQVQKGKSPETYFSLTNRMITYIVETESKELRENWIRSVKQRVHWAGHRELVPTAHGSLVP